MLVQKFPREQHSRKIAISREHERCDSWQRRANTIAARPRARFIRKNRRRVLRNRKLGTGRCHRTRSSFTITHIQNPHVISTRSSHAAHVDVAQ